MGIGDKQRRDNVVFLEGTAGQTLAAALLAAEISQRCPLDVTARCHRDDHVLARN